LLIATLAIAGWSLPAHSDEKLEVTYAATLAGLSFGSGQLIIDVANQQYAAHGNGQVSGLWQLFSGTRGSIVAQGRINRGHVLPVSYQANVSTSQFDYVVRMELQGGNVKELVALPPLTPAADRVPLTEAHRRGVLDPATAVLMPVAGTGEVLGPAACDRTLPIFDGHQRFNVVFSFKRMEMVKAHTGYEGPVVVCAVLYRPVAGHRPGRYSVKYLQEQKDMEVWLAPIAGTRMVVPYRVSVPTLVGAAVIEAERFVTVEVPGAPMRHNRPTHAQVAEPDGPRGLASGESAGTARRSPTP
jgi:hypothetical protein